MTYVTGFLAPVAEARKADYLSHARRAWPLFERHGALAMRECWGVDVPEGEVTSFPMAVRREAGETVVFSWVEWPDRATADACWAAMQSGEGADEMGEMPFDGRRMMWGGFEEILSARAPVPA